ncbi:MAG: hypothetical protein QOH25_875 [Acidobacteriota bacterium]|nr:hypothetical protein [Acidobacteriota bacterium]
MYTMPRSFPRNHRWLAPVSALVLLLLVFFASVDSSAQRRKKPTTRTPQQQGAGANSNTQAAQAKPPKKSITPLRSGDTAEGSRITITSDAPLNDYSAYRSGDRYYVVIPEANAPRAQSGMRGRGFEDVQVQKRGNDAILSFKLQPGTNARVSQRFNRLDVELTTPGGKTAAVTTATPKTQPPTAQPTPQTTPRPTPQTTATTGQNPSTTGTTGQQADPQTNPGAVIPRSNQPGAGGNPAVVYAPTPDASASPGISPEASPVGSPPAEQIAQAQQPPTTQPATTSAPAASSTTLGAILRQNWLVILIAALVLLSLVMIVAARSRAQRGSTTAAAVAVPARRLSRKERLAAKKASAEKAEAESSIPVADILYKSPDSLKARPLATATAVDTAEAVEDEAKAAPVIEQEETTEVEVAPAVDAERIETEVKNVLAGESYDEAVIGATDAGSRQLIATELLAALAARNVERRERAREVFVKHGYLDEATRKLRTADAPAERAAAARSLGYVQDKSTTLHLVVALEDDAPEVRRAAVESLAELRDPAAIQPLKSLLKTERDRKVSRSLIKRAIEASAAVEEEETTTLTSAPAPAPELETVTVETPPAVIEEDASSVAEAETPTLEAESPVAEAEQPTAALADVSSTEILPELVASAAPSLVAAEIDTEAEEAAARREAEEEAARQRAIEEERARAAEERRQAEEAAQLKAQEEEAARVRAEEERERVEEEARLKAEEEARHAEEERLRLAEEARQRAEASQRRAEEEARQREEEEARRLAEAEAQRRAEEEQRLAAEAEARARAEEEEARRIAAEEAAAMLNAEAISPVEYEIADETVTTEASTFVQPVEPFIERNDGTAAGWVDVDVSESEILRHDEPFTVSPAEETAAQESLTFEPVSETVEARAQESKGIEPSAFSLVEEPAARPTSKEIDYAVTEKGLAEFDEFSSVPGAILKRLSSEEPAERAAAVADLMRVGGDDSFREISAAFDDPAVEVRNAAARSLFNLNTDRAATFTRALREAPPERRRKIGSALASSGLASEAIGQLMGESREKTYDAFSLLFLMSKAGEVQPLMRAIEEHPNNEVRLAVVKLLALSGQQEILPAFRRLAVRGSLPTEVRSAVMEAIYQISSQSPTAA